MGNASQSRLLLADNVPDYRKSLILRLKLEGYSVEEAESVQQAIDTLSRTKPDLALIDLRLTDDDDTNDMSGLEVAQVARDMGIPCIIITAFPSVDATRLALRTRGAEPLAVDFVAKASGPDALLGAIVAVLHRASSAEQPDRGQLFLNAEKRLVQRGNTLISVSDHQYKLLELLASQPERVFTAAEIIRAVYGETPREEDARKDKRVERLIERTREKIELDARNPKHLLTEWGRGYRVVLSP